MANANNLKISRVLRKWFRFQPDGSAGIRQGVKKKRH